MITILGTSLLQFSLAILKTFRKSHSCPCRQLSIPKEWVLPLGIHRVERILRAAGAFFPEVWLVLPSLRSLPSIRLNKTEK